MRIDVNPQIHLSLFRATDKAALVEHLQERAIYERTLRIPYPYTEESADTWLALAEKFNSERGLPVQFAIRDAQEFLIGGCGFEWNALMPHRAELGYWLAQPHWGRGIMTDVVGKLVEYAWRELDLTKLTANVFAGNVASVRVLEKCGFEQEGYLKKHYLKDGRCIDALPFGLLR